MSLAPWVPINRPRLIKERLCVFRLDETEHHKIELAATQGFAAC